MNNSSMITAENSSLFSKINTRNYLMNKTEESKKYSNIFIFEKPRRGKSNNFHKSKNSKLESLYLTDLKIKRTRDTTKTNYEFDNSCNNRSRQLSKESLPNITEYNRYIKKPDCFNCCDMQLNPKYLTRLYNNQFKEKKIEQILSCKKPKIKSLRDDKINYIRKTNDIKRIKYEINLKKEAMLEYQDNLKNHFNSINHTISNIKSYKDNLENIFINKYNENIRVLNNNLRDEKLNSDKRSEELMNLQKDVDGLQLLIHKKEAIIKKIEKWLILQIYIKDGKKPKNLKDELLKNYKNKLIFETPEDLDIIFKNKENKNLRLLNDYNKSDEEAKLYMEELYELEKHIGNLEVDTENVTLEKENTLKNIKKKNKELEISLNELYFLKKKYYKFNDNNSIQNKRHRSINMNNDDEIKKNELGIFYKPITNHNNVLAIIDSIYNTIISNNINGLSFNVSYINEINNINTSKTKRANIQMRIIEISFNFLLSYIKEKINSDSNNLEIIREAYHMLDLYHKKIKGNKNKIELENKRLGLMRKIEEKNKKVYFLPRGKIEKYNVVSIKNLKDKHRLKNQIVVKDIDIWDFLHDQNIDEINTNEKII